MEIHSENINTKLLLELQLIIFDFLLITDKRQLLRTCKYFNNITKTTMAKYNSEYSVEKFTIELCNDKYFDMIPEYYIIPSNHVIIELLSINGLIPLLELSKNARCDLFFVPQFAAKVGNIEVLEWCIVNNIIIDILACNATVGNNQLIAIQFLIDKKYDFNTQGYAVAALNGHIESLELLYKNNIPLGQDNGANICRNAAIGGQIEALKWLRVKGCVFDADICSAAASHGHLKFLKWLYANGYHLGWNAIKCAARKGNLKMVKWLIENGCEWNDIANEVAARNGHLDILKFTHEKGYGLHVDVCKFAAINGHFHIIEWACEHGFILDAETCANTAIYGNLVLLKWLRLKNCPWDNRVRSIAERIGHIELLNWAIENGCPE